jgi:lactate dehydrogenase-like 2-hydroxyacid dehydrogenase
VNEHRFDACRRRGVVMSNTPDVLTEATAELTTR